MKIIKKSIVVASLIASTTLCNAPKNFLPQLTRAHLEQLAEHCSHLKINALTTFQAQKYLSLKNEIQTLIEMVDSKERDRVALAERNEEAQRVANNRVATEKQSQESPLLSFVIPCYNRASVVRQTIDTIYSQNITVPFEVIAVDDASTDNSFEILKEYEKKYDNFFAYKNPVNKKAPSTRNVGMLYARGQYICNADSDDVFGPNVIMPMLEAMMRHQYDVCYFQDMVPFYDVMDRSLGCAKSQAPQNEFDLAYMLANDVFAVNCGNRIFTKKSWLNVGGYLEEKGHDSYAFSFRMHAHGYIGYIHPASENYFRMWKNKTGMWQQDQINRVNDVSPLKIAYENLELFTQESQKALLNYNHHDGYFIPHYTKTLKTLPRKTTDAIFAAYEHEDAGDYAAACTAYGQALERGASHPLLYLKQLRAAIFTQRLDQAATIVKTMLQKFYTP